MSPIRGCSPTIEQGLPRCRTSRRPEPGRDKSYEGIIDVRLKENVSDS
jgi:hypothetical protein